ncbi:MAG: VirB3 family type IV secretion system protein [Alphaproteobacteria bacterium]
MTQGRLRADPLFQGLARPPMILGVSYMYFVLNAMITMILFINTQTFLAFPIGVVIHMFGYLLCMKEPRAVELWMLRMKYGYKSWNRHYYHHTNSYDVF